MPLLMENSSEGHSPVIVCDSCNTKITDGTRAVFLCEDSDMPQSALLFAHKGDCHSSLERAFKKGGWSELSELPGFLAHNIGLDTPVD